MNALQLHLTKLIGKKEATIGCKFIMPSLHGEDEVRTIMRDGSFVGMLCEIIGHPATLSDLHRCIMGVKDTCGNNKLHFKQTRESIEVMIVGKLKRTIIIYDSSLDLLDQSEETLKQLIDLITSYQ